MTRYNSVVFGFLPPGVAEVLLVLVLLSAFILVVRSVRRRHTVGAKLLGASQPDLPTLTTGQRVTATVRRVWRDNAQGVMLVEIQMGKQRRFVFCPTDGATSEERYAALIGKEADIALYALSTLAPGGADAMRDQIKDYDKVKVTPDLVRLIPAGQFANDHAVIGRVLSHRDDTMSDGTPLRIYRTQVVRGDDLTLVMELATDVESHASPFADQAMVHGSARLFGYLPN